VNLLFTIALAVGTLFHTALKSSLPAKDASVAAVPTVTLTFTEGVVLAQSAISILKPDSTLVEKLAVKGGSDPAVIIGAVTKPLAPGKYLVRWKTGSDDGHAVRGTYGFTVTPHK
jgi:methionine-rich copper-binding protein CopC